MQNHTHLNALKAIARQCNIELGKHKRKLKKMRPELIRMIMQPFIDKAALLGFTNTRLKYEIALINGVINEH